MAIAKKKAAEVRKNLRPATPEPDTIKTSALVLNDKNPRTITDQKFQQLVKSIKSFPEMLAIRPIIVNTKLKVLGGNMRLRAAIEAGLTEVPVKIVNLTPKREREFIIKDNVGFGEWDWEIIGEQWPEAGDWGLDIPSFPDHRDAFEDDYEAPANLTTDIKPGDLFLIGRHRLLCGDATSAENVARLLDKNRPPLMITDPPYGVNYDARWRLEAGVNKPWQKRAEGKVTNDDQSDWTPAWTLSPAKVAYVWHGGVHSPVVANSLATAGYIIRSQIIWRKTSLVMGRGHYHWQHEPCWYAVKKGETGSWAGDRKQSTVWDIQNMHATQGNVDDGKTIHSTQKPVECMARPIKNHEGDVYDPFGGSGTTMVASHQLGRTCYMMELAPIYCQVIIDRMLKLDPSLKVTKYPAEPEIKKPAKVKAILTLSNGKK